MRACCACWDQVKFGLRTCFEQGACMLLFGAWDWVRDGDGDSSHQGFSHGPSTLLSCKSLSFNRFPTFITSAHSSGFICITYYSGAPTGSDVLIIPHQIQFLWPGLQNIPYQVSVLHRGKYPINCKRHERDVRFTFACGSGTLASLQGFWSPSLAFLQARRFAGRY